MQTAAETVIRITARNDINTRAYSGVLKDPGVITLLTSKESTSGSCVGIIACCHLETTISVLPHTGSLPWRTLEEPLFSTDSPQTFAVLNPPDQMVRRPEVSHESLRTHLYGSCAADFLHPAS